MPLARVVLPAPRLPISSTTPRMGSSRASRWPRAMVSASERVRYVATRLHRSGYGGRQADRVGQVLQQIRGDERLLAQRAGAHFTREPMQVDSGGHGLSGAIRELRQEARDHAGEDVARSAGA